jgi:hypothetical protein
MITRMKDRPSVSNPRSFTTPLFGFAELQLPGQTWWIKPGCERLLSIDLDSFRPVVRNPQSATVGGRGAIQRVALDERETAIIRHYYRGGFIRHFVHDLYWGRPPRPFAELICLETARQRGVPTVEVLGARVTWVTFGWYRGVLVTREAVGFLNLWEWLRSRPAGEERQKTITAVARIILCMHEAGIAHADLNLTNILVQASSDSPLALLIDFDRARVSPRPLAHGQRECNLRRLRRSLNKLDPGGLFTSPADLELFCRTYQQGRIGNLE